MEFGNSIELLSKLIDNREPSSDDELCERANRGPPINPSHIGKGGTQAATKDIWTLDEVPVGTEYFIEDSRPEPNYEVIYSQNVRSEDMYLQLGNKTNSSMSCERIIIKVDLEVDSTGDINLDVRSDFIDVRTRKERLELSLPHPIDDKSAKATWGNKQLRIEAPIIREFDFLNF